MNFSMKWNYQVKIGECKGTSQKGCLILSKIEIDEATCEKDRCLLKRKMAGQLKDPPMTSEKSHRSPDASNNHSQP